MKSTILLFLGQLETFAFVSKLTSVSEQKFHFIKPHWSHKTEIENEE